MRKYGFHDGEIPFDANDSCRWIKTRRGRALHRSFPGEHQPHDRQTLLRVPGLGPITVRTILKRRQEGRLCAITDIGKPGKLLRKAARYLTF